MAETFLYLTTRGRVTGNPHEIEIWFVEFEECYYLCSGGGEKSDWVQNIQQTAQVSFYVAERDVETESMDGQAQVVSDETTQLRVKQLFDQKYNWSKGLLVEICPTTG